ncbi:transglycosylase domain-containing protein [Gryllotalpicola daejeonensis]|uniref:Transglycosylase domain-containing protein n=1 Tax=Gryllotalpicola daejeonensis TaxID=993087 RepID=A0ABP7ZNM0_9MICO
MIAGVLVGILAAPAAIAGTTVTKSGIDSFNALPDYLKIDPPDQYTTFYATQGGKPVKIAQFYFQNRIDVPWDKVSQSVKDAAVATEDPRFYTEGGIDVLGILRGAASTVSGNGTQGGSSITQQYVKNVLVQRCEADNPVDGNATAKVQAAQRKALKECYDNAAGISVPRKIQEIRYATGVSKQYTKQQILLGYLNLVGFGGQVYGVEAAANYYFNTTAAKLDLNQSATLVAILNNPANLRIDLNEKQNPGNNPKNGFQATKDRRDYVLDRMAKNGKITQKQADETKKQPITPHITPTPSGCTTAQQFDAGFFCDYVQDVILNDTTFGKTAADRERFFRQGGINVYTTLNLDLQNTAQQSMDAYIPHSDPNYKLGAAQTSMEVGTGRVVTMVQNKTYTDGATSDPGATAVNYTTPYQYGSSGGFQMGSSFKPFVLAEWLEQGHTLSEGINGSSTWFNDAEFHTKCGSDEPYGSASNRWQIYNDSSWENGYHSVLSGTTESINTIYMGMAKQLNLCEVGKLANKMGVNTSNPKVQWKSVPGSAIGTGNYVSPLQVAQAYAAFANNGISCTPVVINKITRTDTNKSIAVPKTTCTQAIPADVAATVLYALQTVMRGGGTGAAANPYDGIPLAGKTGTAGAKGNAGTENWLATTTSKVAQVTWVGDIDDHFGLRNTTFTDSQTGRVVVGSDAKLYIAKPIIAALNSTYGGDDFPTAPSSMVYGKYYQAPTTPATPNTQPTQPAQQPTQPAKQPTQPAQQPTQPAQQPTQPTLPTVPPSAGP